jgi:hypothetical protein
MYKIRLAGVFSWDAGMYDMTKFLASGETVK